MMLRCPSCNSLSEKFENNNPTHNHRCSNIKCWVHKFALTEKHFQQPSHIQVLLNHISMIFDTENASIYPSAIENNNLNYNLEEWAKELAETMNTHFGRKVKVP